MRGDARKRLAEAAPSPMSHDEEQDTAMRAAFRAHADALGWTEAAPSPAPAVTLTEAEHHDLIRAFFEPGDDCAHNMMPAYATVERIIAARTAEATARAEKAEQERDRLKRGGAELGKSLMVWMELAKDATGSADLVDENGDGDWGAIAERMAEIPARLAAIPTAAAHRRQIARAEKAEADLAEMTREARLSRESTEKAVRARKAAEAEAAALRERLAAVEALADAPYGSENWGILRDGVRYVEAPRLRAALGGGSNVRED